ncbi:unnamed protein product [Camellia sinensis]
MDIEARNEGIDEGFLNGALHRITANQGFYILGLYYANPTFASAMQNSVPAITFVMASAVRLEQVNIRSKVGLAKIIGTVASVGGATLITLYKGPPLLHQLLGNSIPGGERGVGDMNLSSMESQNWTWGCIYLIGHCLSWAAWMVFQEQQQGGVSDEAEPFKGSGRFDGRNLQLHFRSRLSLPLFTGGKVEGEQGAAIHIVLLDVNTGHVVTSGPESTIKLDVVVLEGDFNNEDDGGWTEEEFESHVVKEREGKRPLLTGDLQVTLKERVGTLGELTFTDNSSWIRSKKFRLGLKVASGFCEGIRVGEAKTEAFTVKDHRGELYKKHYPPALNDDVWRLEKIGKDGSFHKRLNKSGIFTVEDFVRLVVRDSQKLRTILSSGMSNKMWDALIEHAKTCAMSGKLYGYYADDTRNVGVVFNSIYKLSGLITGEQYLLSDSLSDSQKLYVDTLVKKAYDNWNHVVIYDGI